MPLTDLAVRAATPQTRPRRLFDGGGLYLEISPAGGRWWRWKYRVGGKERRLSLGVYPNVSLRAARARREAVRQQLAAGIDLGQARKAQKLALTGADSFEAIARDWHAKFSAGWVPSHGDRILRRFEHDLFPWLGQRPLADIRAPELLAVLRRIESRGAVETAHRAVQNCGQVFRYAIATGRAERDPTGDLRGALPPPTERHHVSIIEPKRIGALLRAIDTYEGFFVTKCALRLAPLVFVRPGELRRAAWPEIDLDAAEWRIPAERMKMRTPYLVPLAARLIKDKTIEIDTTTLEANTALRRIVRRDADETYQEFLTRLAQASGIETPTRAKPSPLGSDAPDEGRNTDWRHPDDPDARITRMKDGRTHLAQTVEHAVDVETGGHCGRHRPRRRSGRYHHDCRHGHRRG